METRTEIWKCNNPQQIASSESQQLLTSFLQESLSFFVGTKEVTSSQASAHLPWFFSPWYLPPSNGHKPSMLSTWIDLYTLTEGHWVNRICHEDLSAESRLALFLPHLFFFSPLRFLKKKFIFFTEKNYLFTSQKFPSYHRGIWSPQLNTW